jgi:ABC-type proline/glycine betaine transport system substrate-binding protein
MPIDRRVFLATTLAAALPSTLWAKSNDPIRLALGQDANSQVMSALTAKALRKSGFKVEIADIADELAAEALMTGGLHAHPNLTRSAALDTAIADKTVRSLGGRVGNKRDEPVLKVVAIAMKQKWPDAQKMMKRMVLSDAKLAEITTLVDGGSTPDDAVKAWWKTNKKTWSPWIVASKNWMKP